MKATHVWFFFAVSYITKQDSFNWLNRGGWCHFIMTKFHASFLCLDQNSNAVLFFSIQSFISPLKQQLWFVYVPQWTGSIFVWNCRLLFKLALPLYCPLGKLKELARSFLDQFLCWICENGKTTLLRQSWVEKRSMDNWGRSQAHEFYPQQWDPLLENGP